MTVYYEDLEPGQIWDYGRYTMREDEMVAFAKDWDPRPFHVDPAAAKRSLYGTITASGVMSIAVLTRLCNNATRDWAAEGALGFETLRFPTALKAGDTVEGSTEILEMRLSNSRPGLGIVRSRERLTNQNGEVVVEYEAVFLVGRRPSAAGTTS
jgi:acyl dehydratase